MDFSPTPAFWVSLVPAPFLLYLNVRVACLLWRIKKQSHGRSIRLSRVYHQGRALGVISACFALLPAIVEWRIFVLNPLWSVSYLIGGLLGIIALRMVRKGLESELRYAKRLRRRKKS